MIWECGLIYILGVVTKSVATKILIFPSNKF